MSAKPHSTITHSYSTMESIAGSSDCLICFEMTEKHIFVPSGAPEKLFVNCNKYLHSTLTKGTLKDIVLRNENQVPLCKRCFDSALELTQLSEQLKTIQKDISDLTVTFSMAVFHRRSQVYSIGQSCATSSIVEFNEACLPPNLFSMKLIELNIHPNSQDMDSNGLHLQTDITNVKCETSDIQFDNLSGNLQQSVANDEHNAEIQPNNENVHEQCGQSIIEQNQKLVSVSEPRIVHVTGRNDSKKNADSNKEVKVTMSDLLKSVKMPKIILERLQIVDHKFNASYVNSNQTKCEPLPYNLDEALFQDDEFSVPSCAHKTFKTPEGGKLLKCFYCEKTFARECDRTIHHKTHTEDKLYKRPLGKQKFVYRSNKKRCKVTQTRKKKFYKCSYCEKGYSTPSNLKIHERTHTGEKPFKCSYCTTRFSYSGSLKRHERYHTGEKPFKCSYCNAGFSESGSMKRHERLHTGEKPFKCSFCTTRFSYSYSLKSHERTHTGEKHFKCSFCNKRFNHKCSLTSHEKSHTGKKPLKSSYCNTRLNRSSHVRRHGRTHSGEKPVKSFHQNNDQLQMPTLISQVGTQKEGSLGHLKPQEQIHSIGPIEFKCSFCEMTFSHDEERANHEKTHGREDEIVNENLIVGI